MLDKLRNAFDKNFIPPTDRPTEGGSAKWRREADSLEVWQKRKSFAIFPLINFLARRRKFDASLAKSPTSRKRNYNNRTAELKPGKPNTQNFRLHT